MDDWQDISDPLQNAGYLNNDAKLQVVNSQWPTGASAAQISTESNFNPNAVSPKGARGPAQIMPSTQASLEQRLGRTLDPTDPNDALQMQYEVMKENLQKFKNPADALRAYNGGWNPAKWNNSETASYPNKVLGSVGKQTPPTPTTNNNDAGWQDIAPASKVTASATSDGWETVTPGVTSSAAGAFGRGVERAAIPTTAGVAAFGPGFVAGTVLGAPLGPFAPIAGLAGGLATSMGAGALVGKGQEALLEHFPEAANTIGLGKEQTAADQAQHPTASFLGGLAPQIAFMRPSLSPNLVGRGAGAVIGGGQEAASEYIDNGKVDPGKVAMAAGAGALMDKTYGLGNKMPFAGSHSGDTLTGDAAVEADKLRNLEQTEPTGWQDMDSMLSDSDTQNGAASPYEPNRLSSDIQSPLPTAANSKRQLDLADATSPETMYVDSEGGATTQTPEQLAPFRDATTQRVAELNAREPIQGDLFEPIDQRRFDQYGENAEPRVLDRNEFEQTIDNLANTEGTRFKRPEDMDSAYEKYIDTVTDTQGNLFDRPTLAKNFADQAKQDSIDRKSQWNPVVEANQRIVDTLTQQVQALRDAGNMGNEYSRASLRLEKAQETLDRSKENINKVLGAKDPGISAGKDGVVYLHAGIPLSDLMKSIGHTLRAIHGVVFKTLDKFVKPPTQIRGAKDIIQSALANRINQEANRVWETKPNENVTASLDKVAGMKQALKEFTPFPEDKPYSEIQQMAKQQSDINSNWLTKNIAQGGLMMSNISKNVVIKHVYELVDSAVARSSNLIRQMVTNRQTGLRTIMQKLSVDELTSVHALMDKSEGTKLYSDAELKQAGFNDKQVAMYKRFQQVMNEVWDRVSIARKAAGLPAMDRRVAYMASRMVGDFRRLVYNADGEVVGFLGHQTRMGVNAIARWVQANHPEYTVGDVQMSKLSEGEHSMNPFAGYQEAMNMLAKTNGEVGKFVDMYQQYLSRSANTVGGIQKHALYKKNEPVFGAEGKQAWLDAKANATAGMRSQLKYIDSALRWSELQQAADKAKQIISDPEINQPNAKQWAQNYLDNALGRRTGPINYASNAIVNAISQTTGLGPSWFTGTNNAVKSILLAKFIGIGKFSHSLVTLVQPLQTIKPIQTLLAARGFDGAYSLAPQSLAKGLASSTEIWRSHLTSHTLSDPFLVAADTYARDNGVYDTNMSTHLTDVTKRKLQILKNVAELNVTVPEAGTRSFVYMFYSHMLKDAGMADKDIFPTARQLTKYAMVDYSPHERPLIFGQMGLIGDIASTLTRFKYNQISQHIINGKEGLLPLLSILGSSIMVGGIRGIFGYNVANEALKKLTIWTTEMGWTKQPTSLTELALKHFGKLANYGIFAGIGLNMTGSLTNADTIPDDPLSALFPTGSEIAKMFSSTWNLAKYHNVTAAKQFLYDQAPNSVKGLVENTLFTDKNGNYTNPHDLQLQSHRSQSDQVLRALSFRPLNESNDQLVAQTLRDKEEQWNDLKGELFNKAKQEYMATGTLANASEYAHQYAQYGGDPNQFINQFTSFLQEGQHRTRLERAVGIPGDNLGGIARYQEAQQLQRKGK